MKRLWLILSLTLFSFVAATATQYERVDSVTMRVYFRQGKSLLEANFEDNGVRIEDFVARAKELATNHDPEHPIAVCVTGAASPEGGRQLNMNLSRRRAERVRELLEQYLPKGAVRVKMELLGADWDGLARLVEMSDMPYRDEVLRIIKEYPSDAPQGDLRKHKLMNLEGGRVWRDMEEKFFPELRIGEVFLIYYTPTPEELAEEAAAVQETTTIEETTTVEEVVEEVPPVEEKPDCKPFYMGLKTNLLYDAALVPNIGAEFYLGKKWSVAANWMYAWWHSDRTHYYWRTYGGDLEVRRWFGQAADEKPLTGHHVGLYGGIVNYDFELGGEGVIADPKIDGWSYFGGLSYGYSLPIARRLNLDFTLGVGYLGGQYRKYYPDQGCYVWQSTHQRHWIGPTKAEISLVWLIGCDNYNRNK